MGLTVRLILALLITLAAAVYQRMTGPTHPVDGDISWQDQEISYHLDRSHNGEGDQPVSITVPDTAIDGVLVYRRYNTGEAWRGMKLNRNGDELSAGLPHQPPAGKLEYFIILSSDGESTVMPQKQSVVTRFTGAVPAWALAPHILLMFLAMFMSTAAGLEALVKGKHILKFTLWATGLLFLGGMILGPIVQKFAFNEFWTGIPWGMDLTDNKTLIAMVAWVLAVWQAKKNPPARNWIIAASVILILVYLIPHSVMGSELNYETMQVEVGN